MPIPREKTPALSVPTLDHDTFDLDAESSERGTLVVFYRGLHCPICAKYLMELGRQASAFEERGYGIVAISSDTEERARQMADKVKADGLRFGHSLDLAKAKEWGLYLSTSRGMTSIGIEEPTLFSEPGVFLVNPDRTLYYASVQTMPFSRPHFAELVGALDFTIANDYPARGEYTGEV